MYLTFPSKYDFKLIDWSLSYITIIADRTDMFNFILPEGVNNH